MVYLERRRVKRCRQLTILAARTGSLPYAADEIGVQWVRLLRRTLQSAASFGLHDSEEIADMDVAVEFGLFLGGQLPLACQLGELVHARGVAIAKANRKQVFGRTARQLLLPDLDEAGQDRRFSVGAGSLGTHLVLLV